MPTIINNNESQFLISVNQDSDIFIDNIIAGTVKKNQFVIFKVFPGEHYIEAKSLDGLGRYKSLHSVQLGYQEIIEIKLLPSDVSIGLIGQFVDTRDNQKYKTTTINGMTWLAENLRYRINRSWCYANNPTNCSTYGSLYHFDFIQDACPEGWHLPSREEWNNLIKLYSSETIIKDLFVGGKSNFNLSFGGTGWGDLSKNRFSECKERGVKGSFWIDEGTTLPDYREYAVCADFTQGGFGIGKALVRMHGNIYFGAASLRFIKN